MIGFTSLDFESPSRPQRQNVRHEITRFNLVRQWFLFQDRVQLQQVFMSLMLNGIEGMNDTGGVPTVKSEPRGGQVVVSVSNTGVGLPADWTDRIFDAFFTTKPQGSGMGLAISRSIVESHGGRLWATPKDGRGASSHFSLPTSTEATQAPAAGA